jgi:beta-N-acetylhexosaminidase
VAIALSVMVAAACGSQVSPGPTATPSGVVTPSATASTPSETGSPTAEPTAGQSCAARTFDALTPEQRVGQLFMVGLTSDTLTSAMKAGIASHHLGSVYYAARTKASATSLRAISDAVQKQATDANTGGVRFLIGVNQEGGLIQALTGPGFDTIPSALKQGKMTVATLEVKAKTWGSQLVKAGVNVDLAPVADVVPPGTDAENAPIGKLEREYGHDPDTAGTHVAAFVAGMRAAGIQATAKHFPGLGRVTANTDFTAAVVDEVTTRDDPYLGSFKKAIAADVPFVMVALATYEQIDPDHLAAFSPRVIGDILRGDLGFKGVVMSDSLTVTAVKSLDPAVRALLFIGAGGDLIVLNSVSVASQMADALVAEAGQGTPLSTRVDDATMRVLEAKEAAGLLHC